MTPNQMIVAGIPAGERRVTKAKRRVIVAVGPDDTGGKVRFYFEDEGLQPFHQQMSGKKWLSYEPAPLDESHESFGDRMANVLRLDGDVSPR